jgi:hypothetical protein
MSVVVPEAHLAFGNDLYRKGWREKQRTKHLTHARTHAQMQTQHMNVQRVPTCLVYARVRVVLRMPTCKNVVSVCIKSVSM